MKLPVIPLRWATARAVQLDHSVGSDEPTAPAIDGDASVLEAALHEIGHVVTLRGSLRRALRQPIDDVDCFMANAGLYGVMRDENEVSTIAVELLAAGMLGHSINRADVVQFAWKNKNVRYFADITRFDSRVLRRMRNPRCIRLAREIARHLTKPLTQRMR